MATVKLIEYADASAEVRTVYDDIMATRKTDAVNNFWKALANHPPLLRRTWDSVKQIMAPGALDPLTKEMIYLAVSATNGCRYCIASHTASARGRGMTEAMLTMPSGSGARKFVLSPSVSTSACAAERLYRRSASTVRIPATACSSSHSRA